ncbi:MAG: type III pantothenate kinase [Flavobacteriales bacterium]|nr:type III pantothenate kinase [Flavobacteriales bacterium]
MQLVIDIGSSHTKTGLFSGRDLVSSHSFDGIPDPETLSAWLKLYPSPYATIVSSVNQEAPELYDFIKQNMILVLVDSQMSLPVKVDYRTPETLGNDRLAGIMGAYGRFPVKDVLVIDAGTCITYDLLDKNGVYQGGSISPGRRMRFQALNKFTARLPLVNGNDEMALTGKDTTTSIQSGVQHGILSEVAGIIGLYQQQYKDVTVVLTGGDSAFFDKNLKINIFVAPNLVLEGLNLMLECHAKV